VKRFATACLLLATMVATTAFAQNNPLAPLANQGLGNTTVLPVRDNQNGQVTALLLIEPALLPQLPSQRIIRPASTANSGLQFGNGLQLRAGLSLEANPGLSVLCSNRSVIATVGSLAGNCLLTNFNAPSGLPLPGSRNAANGVIQLQRSNALLTGSVGVETETLDGRLPMIGPSPADRRLLNSLLGPGNSASLDQRNASLIGQISLGTQGWVSIGGTLAHIRLIPTEQLPGGLPPEWNSGSLKLGGGYGNFGAEITGQMIEVPGQVGSYQSLGAGVTWRTPWRARLSVGAENLLSRGKNPFGLPDARAAPLTDEGTVPYVRYQQDL
jgi:hypothetical protein